MGGSWFHREFLTPRRLLFNVLFYGSHLFFFAYGWYSQVWLPVDIFLPGPFTPY